MGELTPEQAHWIPPGKLSPIDALFAHVVIGEDMFLSRFVRQVPALCETSWAAKTGVGEPHPGNPPWDEWAKRVQIDFGSLHEYAQAVYARTEEYLDSLTPGRPRGRRADVAAGRDVDAGLRARPDQRRARLSARGRDLRCQGASGAAGLLFLISWRERQPPHFERR